MTELIIPFLVASGFEVIVSNSLEIHAENSAMEAIDLIIQCWTMDEIRRPALTGRIRAVSVGAGFAG